MSRYLHSFADKASSALNQSGLAQKLPSSVTNALNQAAHPQGATQAGQPGPPGTAPPPSGGAPGAGDYAAPPTQPQLQHQSTQESMAAGGGGRGFGFENLQHQFRALQVQYSSQVTEEVKQLQVMITSSKGVTLAHNNVARDTQAYSKELYAWGQKEKDDIKDVSDRLAWINFTHGALESNLGAAIDAARAPLKSVRDAETTLHPRRAARKTLDSQIKQIKLESKSPQAAERIAELQLKLQKLEQEDAQAELDLDISKRRALQESEQKKWIAIREHAEKLLLLCQASDRVLDQLPPNPPTPQQPYQGAQSTAHTRATLQHALDNFKPGNILLDAPASSLKHHDTLLFGETHAHELSKITSPPAHPPTPQPQSHPQTPVPAGTPGPATGHPAGYHPTGPTPVPVPVGGYVSPTGPTPVPNPTGGYVSPTGPAPLNPGALNNTPAPIPGALNNVPTPAPGGPISPQPAVTSPPVTAPIAAVAPIPDAPTVAETGVPLSAASHGGTGPASGSLAGGHVTGDAAPPPVAAPAKYESAEDEKKRLEREERERILRGSRHGRDPPRHDAGDAFPDASRSDTKDEEEGGPPPYKPY